MPERLNPEGRRMDAELDRAASALPPLPAGITHRISAGMTQQPLRPVTPLASNRVLTARFAGAFLLVALAFLAAMKTIGIAAMSGFQLFSISVVLALGILVLARALAGQIVPGSLQKISAPASVSLLCAAVLAAFVVLFAWQAPEAFFARGWHCFRVGSAIALVSCIPFWLLVRRGVAVETTQLGATFGATVGLLAVTVLQFTCDQQSAGHLATWHGAVLVVSTVAGALVGRFAGRYSHSQRAS